MKNKSLLKRIVVPLAGVLIAGGILFYHPKPKTIQTFNVPLEELIKNSNKYEGNEVITEGYPEYKFISIVPPNVKSVYSLHVEDSTKSNALFVSESPENSYLSNIVGVTTGVVNENPVRIKGKVIISHPGLYEINVEYAKKVINEPLDAKESRPPLDFIFPMTGVNNYNWSN